MLANGNISAQYGVLSGGFAGTDETVALMQKMSQGQYGSRSAKIRAFAINIINQANIPEKDETREMIAIHNWVRDNIRYQKDVHGQETLSHPEETLFNSRAGDCDDKSMLEAALLSSIGIPTRFKTIGTTPMQFSHVYLEARPRNGKWVPLDPIMKNKPAGWEVPQNRQKLVKVYSENRPTGDGAMNGMGYVGQPQTASHLGPTRKAASPYVRMQSFLDSDLPTAQLSQQTPANPQDQNIPQQFPRQRMQAHRRDPVLHRPAGPSGGRLPAASVDAIEAEVMQPGNGVDGVFTPDDLAGLGTLSAVEGVWGVGTDNGKQGGPVVAMPKQSTASPYMQSATVSHSPEGVDSMFTRQHLMADPKKGDVIDYYGHDALNERPPIYSESMAGMGAYQDTKSMMPGMGSYIGVGAVGPGLAQEDSQAPAETAVMPAPNNTMKMVGFGIAAFLVYQFAFKKKRA